MLSAMSIRKLEDGEWVIEGKERFEGKDKKWNSAI